MNKKQLTDKEEIVAKIAENLEITKVAASNIVNVFRDTLLDLIKNSDDKGFRFDGLGTFAVSTRSAKKGRNPKTGEPLHIPEKKVVVFKPSKALKDDINE